MCIQYLVRHSDFKILTQKYHSLSVKTYSWSLLRFILWIFSFELLSLIDSFEEKVVFVCSPVASRLSFTAVDLRNQLASCGIHSFLLQLKFYLFEPIFHGNPLSDTRGSSLLLPSAKLDCNLQGGNSCNHQSYFEGRIYRYHSSQS